MEERLKEKIINAADAMRDFLGLETLKEKRFKEKYPGTPYVIGEAVDNYLAPLREKLKNREAVALQEVLAPVGLHFRRVFIDFLRVGDSGSACWNFSVRLRDIYNHMFEQLGLLYEARLIDGKFGRDMKSNHHWVAVAPKPQEAASASAEDESPNAIIVDGTVDQYRNWHGLNAEEKREFGFLKLLMAGFDDDKFLPYYHPERISPVPRTYFAEKSR